MKPTLRTLVMLAGLGIASGAWAQSTWNMTGGCVQQAANQNNFGNSYVCPQDAGATANATMSAWSSGRDGTGQKFNNYRLTGTGWASAYLGNNGSYGWGAVSRNEANADSDNNNVADGLNVGSPNHSIDSTPTAGVYDFVMVKFDTAQILQQFSIGWAYTDSDITIMRWTGNSAPTTTNGAVTGGGSAANLDATIGAGGWQLVDSYANVATNTATNTGATAASSYWLISAYNTTMDTRGLGWTVGNDGFKLNMLKTAAYSCPNGGTSDAGGHCSGGGSNAPEPASVALAGLAVAFVVRQRRRQSRSAQA